MIIKFYDVDRHVYFVASAYDIKQMVNIINYWCIQTFDEPRRPDVNVMLSEISNAEVRSYVKNYIWDWIFDDDTGYIRYIIDCECSAPYRYEDTDELACDFRLFIKHSMY